MDEDAASGTTTPAFEMDRVEDRLTKIFASFDPTVADYIVSTIIGELEECRIRCIEDVYGTLQTFVPDDMLKQHVEDDDDMEVLVSKLWVAFEKEGAIPLPEEDDEYEVGGCEMCDRDMPLTRHHLKPRSTHKKYLKQGLSQEELNVTASICRPCHSAVHRTHSNEVLASSFDTVEKLMTDEGIRRFVAWARTQKVRTREDALNPKIHYRR